MPNMQDAKHETNDPRPSTSSNPITITTITTSGSPANSLVHSPANQPTQPTKKFQHKNSTIELQWNKKQDY